MSLRARLGLVAGVVALVALAIADLVVYFSVSSSLLGGVDGTLASTTMAIQRALAAPDRPGAQPGPATNGAPGLAAPGSGGANGAPRGIGGAGFCSAVSVLGASAFVEVRAPNGAAVENEKCSGRVGGRGAFAPSLGDVPLPGSGALASPGATTLLTVHATTGSSVLRVQATVLPSGGELLVAVPLDAPDATLHRLVIVELSTGAGALVLALVLGYFLVVMGLRPLREVERTARAITAGDLSQRVPGADAHTEVGSVALALNTMLGEIEQAFGVRDETESQLRASEHRLRRFIADASHELRTPIAAVSAYAELFGKGAAEHRNDLERVMAGIEGETHRMAALVEDLLLLARLDEGRPLELRPVELVALASESRRTSEAVGPAWPVTLEASRPVELVGDPMRLRQVLDNLLANVRAHTPAGTHVTVRIAETGAVAVLDVDDDGPGLPGDSAGRVFERFYRADPSRSRESGGSGLGLAIVASIVEAHGGTVAAENLVPNGTRIRVTLPMTSTK